MLLEARPKITVAQGLRMAKPVRAKICAWPTNWLIPSWLFDRCRTALLAGNILGAGHHRRS